jgi:hypothetical protein
MPLEVWLRLKEPQAPALPQVTDQFTRADEPLLTVAASEYVALTFKDAGGVEAKEIETGCIGWVSVAWLPPPPHPEIKLVPNSRINAARIRMISFRSGQSARLSFPAVYRTTP